MNNKFHTIEALHVSEEEAIIIADYCWREGINYSIRDLKSPPSVYLPLSFRITGLTAKQFDEINRIAQMKWNYKN